MAKKIHVGPTPLDAEVSALLTRIGALDSPLMHVTGYTVERGIGEPHRLTVRLIADDQFDAPAAAGQPIGGDYFTEHERRLIAAGWLPPNRVEELRRLADHGWPEDVYEAEGVGAMVLELLNGGTYDPATGETQPPEAKS